MTGISELAKNAMRNVRISQRKTYPLPRPDVDDGDGALRYVRAREKRERRAQRNLAQQEKSQQ